MSVSGSKGNIYFELGTPRLRLADVDGERVMELIEDHDGLVPMVREFLASIREGRPAETSGEVCLKDLALVQRAYQSMEQGQALPLVQ